jgi:ADP-ribose pyrophosphatase
MTATTIFESKYLRVLREGTWEYVQRRGSRGVVVILACTDEDEIILIEQERIPVAGRVLELPAGLSGDVAGAEDEPLEESARRELLEETGYEADELSLVIEGPTSAGLTDEVISLFVARGLSKTGPGGGDSSEDIVTHLVPVRDVHDFLIAKLADGVMVDPKVFTGLYWLRALGLCASR